MITFEHLSLYRKMLDLQGCILFSLILTLWVLIKTAQSMGFGPTKTYLDLVQKIRVVLLLSFNECQLLYIT